MSPVGAHSEALQAPVSESSREKFFRVLFHDDRNSNYIVFSDAGGGFSNTALKVNSLAGFPFDGRSNYYITHNGFAGKRRLSERTRQLNAIFIDIDCHREPSQAKREHLIGLIQERLAACVLEDRLPMPTLIVDSGRGVQLYYVLRRSVPYRFRGEGAVNKDGVSFYEDIQRRLADAIEDLMGGLDLVDVDRKVFDHSRVGRIPDTFNTKAGRCARLVNACETYYDLPLLAAYCPAKKKPAVPAEAPKKSKPAFVMKFNALMMSRLNKILELQEYRNFDCEGNRELMCFVYYNTAVQIYDLEGARTRLAQFNSRFLKPLASGEIKGVIASVDRVKNVKGEKGHYVLSVSKVIELLGLSDEEITATNFFMSKRMTERLEAKFKTKAKRDARNERIVALCKAGTMTQQQIADEVGCSVRTVRSVIKEAGLARHIATGARKAAAKPRTTLKEAAKTALDSVKQPVSKAADSGFFIFSTMGKKLAHELEGSDRQSVFRASGFVSPGLDLRFEGFIPGSSPPSLSSLS